MTKGRRNFLDDRHPGDISNPAQAQERQRRERQAEIDRKNLAKSVAAVGATADGRLLLRHVIYVLCRNHETPKDGFSSGRFSVGQDVARMVLETDQEIYFTMLKEEQDGK